MHYLYSLALFVIGVLAYDFGWRSLGIFWLAAAAQLMIRSVFPERRDER